MLKCNIYVKKKILKCLEQVKQARVEFNTQKKNLDNFKKNNACKYKAAKGDNVDALLADWINKNQCPVPIKRMGGGYYMFGTKKIYAKIINGKLVIRVGGGYMGIDEFMFYYGAQELNKMLAYEQNNEEKEEVDLENALSGDQKKEDLIKHGGDSASIIGI